MHPEARLDFPIDEEEDLDRMWVFILRKQTKIIYIIGLLFC